MLTITKFILPPYPSRLKTAYKEEEIDAVLLGDSTFSLFLTWNIWAWGLAFLTALVQFLLYKILMDATDENSPTTLFVAAVATCEYDGATPTCEDNYLVTSYGNSVAVLFILLNTLPEMFKGLQLILRFKIRHFIAGCIVIGLAIFATDVAISFMFAVSQTDSASIINCVTVLFISQIDEQTFYLVKYFCPQWLKMIQDNYDHNENSESNNDNVVTKNLPLPASKNMGVELTKNKDNQAKHDPRTKHTEVSNEDLQIDVIYDGTT